MDIKKFGNDAEALASQAKALASKADAKADSLLAKLIASKWTWAVALTVVLLALYWLTH